jgi:tetratricopeptide (TPR) repeat protein
MLAEIELRGGIDAVGVRRDEVELEGEIGAVLRDWCDQLRNSLSSWQSVQRCTIKFIDGRGEAEAAVVMKATDHRSRYRFWLIKEHDQWSIFDYESLEGGFRMSTHNAQLLVRQVKKQISGHELDRASALVDKARNLLVRGKIDEAEEPLNQAEALSHPNTLLPVVKLLQAEILLRRTRLEEALSKVDEALLHRKDYPQAVQMRGFILFGLKRFEESIRSQEEFMKIIGDDSAAWMGIGMCQEALGDRNRAKEAYRKGAACDDADLEIRERLKKLEESGR